MLTAILAALLPFVLNGAMGLPKWLTKVSSTPVMRFFRAVLSIVGVISFSAAKGTPLDTGSINGLIQTAPQPQG